MEPEPPSLLFNLLLTDLSVTAGFLLLIILLFVVALASGFEASLSLLEDEDLENENNKSKKKNILNQLIQTPKKTGLTLLITKITCYIFVAILTFHLLDFWLGQNNSENWYSVLKIAIPLVLILTFGEILPKIHAGKNPLRFLLKNIYLLKLLDVLLTPLSLPLRTIIIFIKNTFGKPESQFSVDQLSQALDLSSEGDTSKEEKQILQGIVSFGNTETRQVMKPRMEIIALRHDASFQEILQKIVEQGFSRIPVYTESLDNINGILYIKDLVPHIDKKDFQWQQLLREPYFVTETKKLDDLLNEFKEKHVHLAVVVDEYGGTSGIISLEDVIEEIVGEISDEYDQEDIIYSKIDDNVYVFEGKTPLKDFYKAFKIEDIGNFEAHKGDAETLAGFVLELSEGFPSQGDVIKFYFYSFTIEAFDNKRIKQIKVSKTEE